MRDDSARRAAEVRRSTLPASMASRRAATASASRHGGERRLRIREHEAFLQQQQELLEEDLAMRVAR
jgi:hypothetical protein